MDFANVYDDADRAASYASLLHIVITDVPDRRPVEDIL